MFILLNFKHSGIKFISFLDELFLKRSFASRRIKFITKYLDENRKDLSNFFEFEKDGVTPESVQNYRFLKNIYSIGFLYPSKLLSIVVIDRGIRDDAEVPQEKAIKIYDKLKEEIKEVVKKESEVRIKTNKKIG